MRIIFKYNDVAIGDPADGGNTQISLDVSWLYCLNPTAAAATLKLLLNCHWG